MLKPTQWISIGTFLALGLLWSPTLLAEEPNPFEGGQPSGQPFSEKENVKSMGNLGFGSPKAQAPAKARPTPTPSSSKTTTKPPRTQLGQASDKSPKAPKLDDYLKLESNLKNLEVKNFDLPDRDIRDVVTLISKWTGKNFILDSKVRGKITILGPSQVTLQEAYHAFLAALAANGLTTVESGKFIRIIESAEARRSPVKTYTGDYAPNSDQFITRIYQLKYINADEVQREFRDMTTRQGKLFAYEPTNSIIITDTGSNIERIVDILKTLDVKSFETSLHVVPIEHGSSKSISEMLQEIYSDDTTKGSSRTRSSFKRSNLERARGGGVITKIIPDESTNSLVVLANAQGLASLKKLVAKLDVKVTDSGKIQVYYCEHAKATELAETLAALAGSSSTSPNRGGTRNNSRNSRRARTQTTASSQVSAELDGGVRVTADEGTNSLVIVANAADYSTLKRVIEKLDIPRLQVLIETAILEVAVDDAENRGLNVGFEGSDFPFAAGFLGDKASGAFLLSKSAASLPTGLTVPFKSKVGLENLGIKSLLGLVNFLTTNSKTSVLSTPQIIALDNEEAEFKVQDEIPVVSSFSPGTATNPIPTQNVEIKKVGIDVKLTPHINPKSRNVRLEIEQKVDSLKSSGVPEGLANFQQASTTRETNTTVIVPDGDYVMLGGLMSDRVTEEVTKVPLLGDIPILGWLFKSTKEQIQKSNLVILLRPRIIDTAKVSAELIEEKLDRRRKFIKENMDDGDHYQDTVGGIREDLIEQKKHSQKRKEIRNMDESDEREFDAMMDDPEVDAKEVQRLKAQGKAKLSAQPAQREEKIFKDQEMPGALKKNNPSELTEIETGKIKGRIENAPPSSPSEKTYILGPQEGDDRPLIEDGTF